MKEARVKSGRWGLVLFICLALVQNLQAKIAAPSECNPEILILGNSDFRAEVMVYPAALRHQKSLILFPPTGGANFLDRSYAGAFCRAGYDVWLLKSWTGDQEFSLDLGIHQRLYERAQRAVALSLEKIQGHFVGILGTSVGGIHAAISMAFHDRLDAAFVITAGVPIADVIATTDQEVLADVRRQRRELFKFQSNEEYSRALQEHILYEPTKLPRRFEGKALGMLIATRDTTVPVKYQNVLREFWRPQTVYEISNNHFFGIIRSWLFFKGEIIDFFDQAVKAKSQRP